VDEMNGQDQAADTAAEAALLRIQIVFQYGFHVIIDVNRLI
jgi:hypothetical protein